LVVEQEGHQQGLRVAGAVDGAEILRGHARAIDLSHRIRDADAMVKRVVGEVTPLLKAKECRGDANQARHERVGNSGM
jgi:hypothetical protein